MDLIAESVEREGAKKRGQRRDKSNTASAIGHPCIRNLIYRRTAWDKAQPISVGLAGVYETGHELQPVIERILSAAGQAATPRWRVIGSETELRSELLEKYQISGHIDGVIQVQDGDSWDDYGVCDIKTSTPNVFNNLSDYDSLSKYPWMENYIAQLSVYAIGTSQTRCLLIFVNKANLFEVKVIEWDLDQAFAETLLKKAQAINDFIVEGELPPKINRPDICGRCQFAAECMPDLEAAEGMTIVADEDLTELLDRRAELQAASKEFAGIDRKLKARLVGGKDIICGNHVIVWTERSKKAFSVAATTFWQKKITSLQPKSDDTD